MYLKDFIHLKNYKLLTFILSLAIISFTFGTAIPNIYFSIFSILIILYLISIRDIIFYDKVIFLLIFLFIFLSIISSLRNINEIFFLDSLNRSITNIRFFLVGFVIFFIIKNVSCLKLFNNVLLIYLIFLSSDIIFQYYNGTDFFNLPRWEDRAAGFFAFNGEYIAGSFMVKILLPSIFFFNTYYKFKFKNLFISLTTFLFIYSLFLTGERASIINFIIILLIFFIIKLLYKQFKLNYLKTFILFVLSIIVVIGLVLSNENYKKRLIDQTKIDFLDKNSILNSRYFQKFYTGQRIFYDYPLLGSGPKTFRSICNNYSDTSLGCSTHPHNFHIEILSEYGFINYIILFMILFYFIKISNFKVINFQNDYCLILFLIFLIQINPFSVTGSFFSSFSAYIFWINFFLFLNYSKYKFSTSIKK